MESRINRLETDKRRQQAVAEFADLYTKKREREEKNLLVQELHDACEQYQKHTLGNTEKLDIITFDTAPGEEVFAGKVFTGALNRRAGTTGDIAIIFNDDDMDTYHVLSNGGHGRVRELPAGEQYSKENPVVFDYPVLVLSTDDALYDELLENPAYDVDSPDWTWGRWGEFDPDLHSIEDIESMIEYIRRDGLHIQDPEED